MKIEIKVIDQVNGDGNMKSPDKKFISAVSKVLNAFMHSSNFKEELGFYEDDAVGTFEITVK